MLIIAFSEDKLSLTMFYDFFKKFYCSNIIVKDLNSLFDYSYQEFILKTALQESFNRKNILIKYKIKSSLIPDIPDIERANLIVKFEGLFSIFPMIIKTDISELTEERIIKDWNKFIKI